MPSARQEHTAADEVLAAEREHLRRSREDLGLMRTDVLSLRAMGGDPVSEEYLKADLYRRAEALRDLPDTPLFFGRLDYRPGAVGTAGTDEVQAADVPASEHFHVGRRHVHDPHGTPVVIDWRAPVSRPFYRASQADPMGLEMRRRFGFDGGELTAFEDERFGAGVPQAPAGTSRILIEEIERPRSGPMRDIVATIQPDQDDIVRAGVEQTVCVQGAPGTGKTAVGLHRVAYLLYAHAQRLSRGGVLVIGPNKAFLAYIQNVLPALGELDVAQLSVADLTSAVGVRGTDSEQAARVKGDARMAQVLSNALWEQLAEPAEPIMLARGSRRWRVSAAEIAELAAELRDRGVRYGTGRDMLTHRIAHVILTRMEAAGETCDDRTHESVRRSKQVQAAVAGIWPKADPIRLVFRLLSDPDVLKRAANGVLDEAEQALITWSKPPRSPGSARWSAADAVLIDETADLIERTPSLAHIVVDEAQDLSPMQCRAIGRRCATGSATVLGDIAQGTTAWATTSWDQMLGYLGKPDADYRVLDTGYRVPRQILDFASKLLTEIAPGLSPATSVRQDPGALVIRQLAPAALDSALAAACSDALGRPGSAAVIAADDQIPALGAALTAASIPHAVLEGAATGERITLVPVTLAKGLEFDQVIVYEPNRIASAEARGLHRLYVALTRAVSRLTVLHAEPLPPVLA
ncbi:MAG TPA: ATP-binding domain-containing protein [Streptosporangiaceae bacterium]|nr:ATP-binding domain-containing protein [Streptosporangiaceae bacterium]